MLWQYLLLTLVIVSVETIHRRTHRKNIPVRKMGPRFPNRSQHSSLRIRNEVPFHQQEGEDNTQVSDGNITNTFNFPYMAAILINGRLWCAGAIVDRNWVLTAAHCLNFVIHVAPSKTLSQHVKVRVGSSKAHEGGKLMDVVGAITHPKYEVEPVPHADVALLKLAGNLEFHKYVNRIHIYDGDIEPYAQSFIEVSGWGATRGFESSFRDYSPDILTARLKVRPQQYCIDSYQLVDGFQFTSDFFCSSLRNGTRDVCLFDAGAPAVQKNQLMGLMSFGPETCGHIFQPAVFIKAFYFRNFVRRVIYEFHSERAMMAALEGPASELEATPPEPDYGGIGNAPIQLLPEETKDISSIVNA